MAKRRLYCVSATAHSSSSLSCALWTPLSPIIVSSCLTETGSARRIRRMMVVCLHVRRVRTRSRRFRRITRQSNENSAVVGEIIRELSSWIDACRIGTSESLHCGSEREMGMASGSERQAKIDWEFTFCPRIERWQIVPFPGGKSAHHHRFN